VILIFEFGTKLFKTMVSRCSTYLFSQTSWQGEVYSAEDENVAHLWGWVIFFYGVSYHFTGLLYWGNILAGWAGNLNQ
jgi:hypothetical protein